MCVGGGGKSNRDRVLSRDSSSSAYRFVVYNLDGFIWTSSFSRRFSKSIITTPPHSALKRVVMPVDRWPETRPVRARTDPARVQLVVRGGRREPGLVPGVSPRHRPMGQNVRRRTRVGRPNRRRRNQYRRVAGIASRSVGSGSVRARPNGGCCNDRSVGRARKRRAFVLNERPPDLNGRHLIIIARRRRCARPLCDVRPDTLEMSLVSCSAVVVLFAFLRVPRHERLGNLCKLCARSERKTST